MFKVITAFRDLETNHRYEVGDTYPAEGEATKKRIKELSGADNKAKRPLIEEVIEEPIEEPIEEIEEKPKKKRTKKGK